jgi:ubiquinone/menaquinone biosynthesis C-methylase UbiE
MATVANTKEAAAGAAVYNKLTLNVYDLFVLGFSNRMIWKCPTSNILDWYNKHVSGNHLDVGVGTGYLLDKCTFPIKQPQITLLDLNPSSLAATSKRLARYNPKSYQANVLESITVDENGFDSIGMSYLLHCLPGTMQDKGVVFANLKPLLSDGGTLFGTTILGESLQYNFLAKRMLKIYNRKGIFSNYYDNLQDLESNLQEHFTDYSTHVIGNVAFFMAHI